MNILVLSDTFPPESAGGADVVAWRLAHQHARMGHRVTVVSTTAERAREGLREEDGLPVHRVYSRYLERFRNYLTPRNPFVLGKLRKLLPAIAADVVHAHNVHSHLSFQSLQIAAQGGRPVIFHAHDYFLFCCTKFICADGEVAYTHKPFDCVPCQRARYNPLRNRGIRGVVKDHVSRIVGISQALATALAHNGYPGVTPVHNGVDPEAYAPPGAAEVTSFRAAHGLDDRPVVLLAARLSGSKGAGQLVDAMAHVPGDAMAVLLGNNPAYQEKLARQAAAQGCADRVRFLGWLTPPEVKLAYYASDLVVAPSTYPDPFNLTLIEGMACGKPVIGSAFGAAREIIVDGETGYVVNPLDTNALAGAIRSLLQDPTRRQSFGATGQARVQELFTLQQQAERMLGIYDEALAESRAAAAG
jgi:glycosyltransferase involved in cell wall biosynthesis